MKVAKALVLIGLVLLIGCRKAEESKPAAPSTPPASPAPAQVAKAAVPSSGGGDFSSRTDKLKFRDAAGYPIFSIKIKEDGAKLVDGNETELARLKTENRVDGTELKIKSPDEKMLGSLTGSWPKWKLKDADKKTQFEIRGEDDGSLKVQDGSEGIIYRINTSDNGVEVLDDHDAVVIKVTSTGGKIVVHDATGKAILMTTDGVLPRAIAFLSLNRFSRPQAAALFLTFNVKHS